MLMTEVFYYSLTRGVHALGFDYYFTSVLRHIYAAVWFKYMWKL